LISKNIDWLPVGLQISGDLWLNNAKITELPNGLKILRNLFLSDTSITELPNDLQVTDTIWARSHQKKLITFMQNSIFKDKLNVWH